MKTALDMEFDEFVRWATGYVLMGIGGGTPLKELMDTVIDHACRNKIFGKGAGS